MKSVKKPLHRALCVLLSLSFLIMAGGCSGSITANYRDISTLQPVQTLGFDAEGQDFSITMSTGEWGEEQSSTLISSADDSICNGFKSIQDYSGKNEIYFLQTRFILVGNSLPKENIGRLIGFLENSDTVRLDASMFIVKGGSAKDLIVSSGDKNYDISDCLAALKGSGIRRGEGSNFTCNEIFRSLSVCGSALVPAIEAAPTENKIYSESGEKAAIPAGYAIFKGNEICAFIDRDDCTLGANLLLNKSGEGPIAIHDGDGTYATLYIDKAKTKYSAQWEGGKVKKIIADVNLATQLLSPGAEISQTTKDYYEQLKNQLKQETEKKCKTVLNLSRVLRSDFLWLGPIFREKYPREYKNMSGEYSDAASSAEIEVNVSVNMARSIIDKPKDKERRAE